MICTLVVKSSHVEFGAWKFGTRFHWSLDNVYVYGMRS